MKKIQLDVVVIVAACTTYLIYNPDVVVIGLTKLGNVNKGITRSSVVIDGEKWVYNSSGKGEALVLIHGFGTGKEVWNAVTPYLAEHYHVIAVDMPGFGESTKNPDKTYTISDQTARLRKFIKHLGLPSFYLGGNSLGGAIASDYAAKFPSRVKALWLISPAGVDAAEPSEFDKNFDEVGDNIMITRTLADFDNMMTWLYTKPPEISPLLKRGTVALMNQNADFMESAFDDLMSDWTPLEDTLESVELPVLITWGLNDRLNHISGAQVLADILPDVEIHMLPNCGSLVMVECSQDSAKEFIDFATSENKEAMSAQ